MTDSNSDLLAIESPLFKKAALMYRAINHKLRQQILHLLHTEGQMVVTDLYVKLRLEQSVASQHLAILRRAQLVIAKREGKHIYYSVNHERLNALHTNTEKLLS